MFTIKVADEPRAATGMTKEELDAVCTSVRGCVYQQELGEGGYNHFQGYVRFKSRKRFSTVKRLFCRDGHFETCRNPQASEEYCQKEDSRVQGPFYFGDVRKPLLERRPMRAEIEELRPWQAKLVELLNQTKSDDRVVFWVYDPEGCSGKTTLMRTLTLRAGIPILASRAAAPKDLTYQYAKMQEAGKEPELIVLDLSRSSEEAIAYGTIEEFKDGFVTSAKYESCTIVAQKMTSVLVLSNRTPDRSRLTADRWRVLKITEGRLEEEGEGGFRPLAEAAGGGGASAPEQVLEVAPEDDEDAVGFSALFED